MPRAWSRSDDASIRRAHRRYDIDLPDLAGVPGFDPSWALTSGVVNWTAFRVGGTLPLGRDATAFDGVTRRTSTLQGTMTMP